MNRTAEEFVHQLPNGMWFVGDYVRGQGVTALYLWTDGTERTARSIQLARVDIYKHKASAKRAAQAWLEAVLDDAEAVVACAATKRPKGEGVTKWQSERSVCWWSGRGRSQRSSVARTRWRRSAKLCGCEWMERHPLTSLRGVEARVDLWCDEDGSLGVRPVSNRQIGAWGMLGTFVLTGPPDEQDEEGNGGDPTGVPAERLAERLAELIAALGTA